MRYHITPCCVNYTTRNACQVCVWTTWAWACRRTLLPDCQGGNRRPTTSWGPRLWLARTATKIAFRPRLTFKQIPRPTGALSESRLASGWLDDILLWLWLWLLSLVVIVVVVVVVVVWLLLSRGLLSLYCYHYPCQTIGIRVRGGTAAAARPLANSCYYHYYH